MLSYNYHYVSPVPIRKRLPKTKCVLSKKDSKCIKQNQPISIHSSPEEGEKPLPRQRLMNPSLKQRLEAHVFT